MKREFLQNFKVGDQPLPKEVIDAIMAENGRDIEAAKKPFADYDALKSQLEKAQKTIKGFKDQNVDGVRMSSGGYEFLQISLRSLSLNQGVPQHTTQDQKGT